MSGHYGASRKTVKNLEIMRVDADLTCRGPRRHWGSGRRGEFGRRACVLAGGTWTQNRRSRAGQGQALCPHCGQAPETVQHRWWECPKWEQERRHPGQPPSQVGLSDGSASQTGSQAGLPSPASLADSPDDTPKRAKASPERPS